MVFRSILRKSKDKVFILFIVIIISACFYVYLLKLQAHYDSTQWSGEHCSSELTSIKYQLSVVTEYKNRIDKLLSDTLKSHQSDREKFRDIMESCVAMKQQASICQSQFEDLQSECSKVRENYDNALKEMESLKSAG